MRHVNRCIAAFIFAYFISESNMAASGNGLGEEHVAVQKLQPQAKIYERLLKLGAFYKQEYDVEPEFYVRVPGR